MGKPGAWVRDNVVGIVSVAVDVGALAWVHGEWASIQAFASTDLAGLVAFAVFFLALGFVVACLAGVNSYAAKRFERRCELEDARRREAADRERHDDAVRRMCDVLSLRQKAMLREILERGSMEYPGYDREAEMLCQVGLAVRSEEAYKVGELVLMACPTFVDTLRAHPEWLG